MPSLFVEAGSCFQTFLIFFLLLNTKEAILKKAENPEPAIAIVGQTNTMEVNGHIFPAVFETSSKFSKIKKLKPVWN